MPYLHIEVLIVKESLLVGLYTIMTDSVALEPSELTSAPRVGEKVCTLYKLHLHTLRMDVS